MSRNETLFVPEPGNERAFRTALGTFATGVTVVSAATPDGPLGMTVNSFASLSLDPPLVLWSSARTARRHAAFMAAEHYAIHVLAAEQHALGLRFAREGHAFEGLDWRANGEGVPVIAGTLARFECERWRLYEGGDHTIVVGRVLRVAQREGEPLCFSMGGFGRFAEGV